MVKEVVRPASASLYNHSYILYQQWITLSIQCGKHRKGKNEGKIKCNREEFFSDTSVKLMFFRVYIEMELKRVQINHVILSFQELFFMPHAVLFAPGLQGTGP